MAAGQKKVTTAEKAKTTDDSNKYGINLKKQKTKKTSMYIQLIFSEPTSTRMVCHLFQTVCAEKLIKPQK